VKTYSSGTKQIQMSRNHEDTNRKIQRDPLELSPTQYYWFFFSYMAGNLKCVHCTSDPLLIFCTFKAIFWDHLYSHY